MDHYLEAHELSAAFAAQGKVVQPSIKKINLDLPKLVIDNIDKVARKIGISRQPLIKMWIHEKLNEELTLA